jgi:hypothetical protein
VARKLVQRVQSPALPIPKAGPLKEYLDALNNILRLFFNLLSNAVNTVFGDLGGRFLDVPNALYFSTADQPIAVVDTGQVITFNQTYLQSGITINGGSNSQITATYDGVYNLQLSGQPFSSSASTKLVYVWITRNGVDLGYTAKEFALQGSSDVHNMTYNFNIDLAAGEYIEFKWSSSSVDTTLNAQVATAAHPAVASAVITVNFISALPAVRPTPP